jgi:hypothetical protein
MANEKTQIIEDYDHFVEILEDLTKEEEEEVKEE